MASGGLVAVRRTGARGARWSERFSRETVPDQLLAVALLGTAAIQVAVVIDPRLDWSAAMVVPEVAGFSLRVAAGTWLLLTAGRPRGARTRLAIVVLDCVLLTWSFAVIQIPQSGMLGLLLARLPFVCAALRGRQLRIAVAVLLLVPGAALAQRTWTTSLWDLGLLWMYLVAAFVVGGSTSLVTRALTASEQRALASAAQARELAAVREHEALHDALTGLPNRVLYADRLAGAATHAQRTGSDVAVLLIDVDRFKLVNDSRGHHAGDELLVRLSRRLDAALRSSDTLARLGGDEFAVIVQDVRTPADALAVVAHLRGALREPFTLDGSGTAGPQSVYVTVSCGIAYARGRLEELGAVLREADAAMYLAKARGRGMVEVFDESLGEVAQRRLHLENQLRHDVETGSDALSVAYQPLTDPVDGRVLGVEALARWSTARYGTVGPDEFINIAEDCELIHDLGRRVLRTTLDHAGPWLALHPDLEIAVNVSPVQLRRPDFTDQVTAALTRARVAPERLCLEITEGVLLDPQAVTVTNLHALHEAGVELAVDDFGSGYSSLAQLRRYAIAKLKADRSFIDDPALLRAVADLAAALGAHALAEGVETARQRETLVRLGYRQAQGYLWARPQTAEALADLLRSQRAPRAAPHPRQTGG